jgi:hypothetical protein
MGRIQTVARHSVRSLLRASPFAFDEATNLLHVELLDRARAGSLGTAGCTMRTAMPCALWTPDGLCPAPVITRHEGPGTPIHWECRQCGRAGTLTDWEGSAADLSRFRRRRNGPQAALQLELQVGVGRFWHLRRLVLADGECRALIFGARPGPHGPVLRGTPGELAALDDMLAAEISQEVSENRRRNLAAVLRTLRLALAELAAG